MQELLLIRKSLMLTQEEMANKIGVSVSYYSKVEGGFKQAGRGFIDKFAKAFPHNNINIFFKLSL